MLWKRAWRIRKGGGSVEPFRSGIVVLDVRLVILDVLTVRIFEALVDLLFRVEVGNFLFMVRVAETTFRTGASSHVFGQPQGQPSNGLVRKPSVRAKLFAGIPSNAKPVMSS